MWDCLMEKVTPDKMNLTSLNECILMWGYGVAGIWPNDHIS